MHTSHKDRRKGIYLIYRKDTDLQEEDRRDTVLCFIAANNASKPTPRWLELLEHLAKSKLGDLSGCILQGTTHFSYILNHNAKNYPDYYDPGEG